MSSAVDTVQNISHDFLWPARQAMPLMKTSLAENSCYSALKARAYFVAQAIASLVAIPFILIASLFVMIWNLFHCKVQESLFVIPAAAIHSAFHVSFFTAAVIGAIAPMSWTNKCIDRFEVEEILERPGPVVNTTSTTTAPNATVEMAPATHFGATTETTTHSVTVPIHLVINSQSDPIQKT